MKHSGGNTRGVPGVLDSDTAFDFAAACSIELDICRRCRPNVLVIGSPENHRRVLAHLISSARTPFQIWPLEGSPRRAGTVIVWGAADLDAAQQRRILDWLLAGADDVQIISLSERTLFPLLERGAFLGDLYYRLNVIVIDCRETR